MKTRKTMLLILLLLVMPMVLAACGGDISEDDAEKALKAGFEGDRDEANKFFCDADKIGEDDAAMPDGVEVANIECKKEGDNMNCSADVTVAGQSSTVPFVFKIEDGKLCGGNLAPGS